MTHQSLPSAADRGFLLLQQVDRLRADLRQRSPFELASRTGGTYRVIQLGEGEFSLSLWGQAVRISFPGWIAYDQEDQQLNPALQALLVYHFHTSDGSPAARQFIAFSDLEVGRFYTRAFQNYTGDELRRTFRDDQTRFISAALTVGGVPYPLGDAAFTFPFLPRVELLVVFWRGDEDFPSNYQILFDAAASNHLPTDACAMAGSMLTRKLTSLSS